MKKNLFLIIFLLLSFLLFIFSCKNQDKQHETEKQSFKQTQEDIGSTLFNNHCIMCHHDGSNLKEIKNQNDIINAIRNPKPGMPKFTKEEIPDDKAEAIAKFIFYTLLFKK